MCIRFLLCLSDIFILHQSAFNSSKDQRWESNSSFLNEWKFTLSKSKSLLLNVQKSISHENANTFETRPTLAYFEKCKHNVTYYLHTLICVVFSSDFTFDLLQLVSKELEDIVGQCFFKYILYFPSTIIPKHSCWNQHPQNHSRFMRRFLRKSLETQWSWAIFLRFIQSKVCLKY